MAVLLLIRQHLPICLLPTAILFPSMVSSRGIESAASAELSSMFVETIPRQRQLFGERLRGARDKMGGAGAIAKQFDEFMPMRSRVVVTGPSSAVPITTTSPTSSTTTSPQPSVRSTSTGQPTRITSAAEFEASSMPSSASSIVSSKVLSEVPSMLPSQGQTSFQTTLTTESGKCQIVGDDGTVTTYDEGEYVGDFIDVTSFESCNGSGKSYPCHCVASQLACIYCYFLVAGCARNEEQVVIRNGTNEEPPLECICYAELVPIGDSDTDSYDVVTTSTCTRNGTFAPAISTTAKPTPYSPPVETLPPSIATTPQPTLAPSIAPVISLPPDIGCRFTQPNGTIVTFEEGAIMGDSTLTTCSNGVPSDYPCYCISGAVNQTVCPYCQFTTYTFDQLGNSAPETICSKNNFAANVLSAMGKTTTCVCTVDVQPVGSSFDVKRTSNCPLLNAEAPLSPSPTVSPQAGSPTLSPPTQNNNSQSPDPTPSPSVNTAPTPPPSFNVTFAPGKLNVFEVGLLLSEGLQARVIAVAGRPVFYGDGTASTESFHQLPDGAAVFPDNRPGNTGGYLYTSNSEAWNGGVGAITFNSTGDIIGYRMILTGTSWNCNGGPTPWGTWISAEEDFDQLNGRVWQVDPYGFRDPEPITLGKEGGAWEAFAYDVRNPAEPKFFLTEDDKKGALQRFQPFNASWDNPWSMLVGEGVINYLVLEPISSTQGTYRWTTDRDEGRQNAGKMYPNSEGIAVDGHWLYFVSKTLRHVYRLDLDGSTYSVSSTTQNLFDGEPDQVGSFLRDDGSKMLYFTEDGGDLAGIHARNEAGEYFTILEGLEYKQETTGIAFSPDGRHLYFAHQEDGYLFDVTRTDGLSFHAKSVNLKPRHNEHIRRELARV